MAIQPGGESRFPRSEVPPDPLQGEGPALLRAEELSSGYLRDILRQAFVIARQRGPNVQRTEEDVVRADQVLRGGFQRRRASRRTIGQAVATTGALLAGVGGTALWTEPKTSPLWPWFFVFLLGGMVLAFAGIALGYGTE